MPPWRWSTAGPATSRDGIPTALEHPCLISPTSIVTSLPERIDDSLHDDHHEKPQDTSRPADSTSAEPGCQFIHVQYRARKGHKHGRDGRERRDDSGDYGMLFRVLAKLRQHTHQPPFRFLTLRFQGDGLPGARPAEARRESRTTIRWLLRETISVEARSARSSMTSAAPARPTPPACR